MLASVLLEECLKAGIGFFTGVPDSFLKGLCDELYDRWGTDSPEPRCRKLSAAATAWSCT